MIEDFEIYSPEEIAKRTEALSWLADNITDWPCNMDKWFTGRIYKSYRFVETFEGDVLFANCLVPGITRGEWETIRNARVLH